MNEATYTKEPIKASGNGLHVDRGNYGACVAIACSPDDESNRPVAHANAKRIEQCWNATLGIENVGAIPSLVQTVRDFAAKCPAFAECAELDAALAALESKGGGE